jgi:hypothetical protein
MSDEKQKAHELEATAMVEACAKVLYDISDHARDFEALARRVLADRKAAVDDANRKADAHYEAKMEGLRQFAANGVRAAVKKAENDWACACRMDCERERAERDTYWGERFDLERAERIAKVEEAVEKAENDWACACRMDCERERAERLRAVEEATNTVRLMVSFLPNFPGKIALDAGISAIVAAAKGEKP